jgi:sigma-B regulation protein RsbU (phosphoserine phosphatase)
MPAKILVVDDEPDLEELVRQRFRRKIRDNEYDFVFARSGADALEKLKSNGDVDLVLSDINMPVMDGLTLLGHIRTEFPLVKSVIVSAYGDMDNIRTAMNRGAFDFVTKPINFQDLEVTVEKTITELANLKQALKARDELISLQRELNVATEIQVSILPRTFPPFPDRKDFEVYAAMIPAKEVGGDFYDFFLIDDDHLGIVIGDVSGKGIPAAMFMAVSKTLLKATAMQGLPPHECFNEVNQILSRESVRTMFVTTFYGILNTKTGELEYCNGGHNPPYLLSSSGTVSRLEGTGGIALAAIGTARYSSKKTVLKRGDGILLYTDGVTEAMDRQANEFSNERLEQVLPACLFSPITELVESVMKEVKAFTQGAPQSDDITLLALRYSPTT